MSTTEVTAPENKYPFDVVAPSPPPWAFKPEMIIRFTPKQIEEILTEWVLTTHFNADTKLENVRVEYYTPLEYRLTFTPVLEEEDGE